MLKQVGEILVDANIITTTTLDRALDKQKSGRGENRREGNHIGAILIEMGVITDTELVSAIAKQFDMKVVKDFASHPFHQDLLSLIPEDLAISKNVFPLKQQGMTLSVAVIDPYDADTLDYLAKKTNLKIVPVLATPTDMRAAVRKHYLRLQGSSDKLKILVIDDSTAIAMLIETALMREGYEVMVAHDGMHGMKLAMTYTPDLIITDIVMPLMNGYALLKMLKAAHSTKDIPVILLTSSGSPEEELKALRAGFIDFIVKPVMPMRIIARVNRALELVGLTKR